MNNVTEELVRQNGNQAAAVMADYAGGSGGGGINLDLTDFLDGRDAYFDTDEYYCPVGLADFKAFCDSQGVQNITNIDKLVVRGDISVHEQTVVINLSVPVVRVARVLSTREMLLDGGLLDFNIYTADISDGKIKDLFNGMGFPLSIFGV